MNESQYLLPVNKLIDASVTLSVLVSTNGSCLESGRGETNSVGRKRMLDFKNEPYIKYVYGLRLS